MSYPVYKASLRVSSTGPDAGSVQIDEDFEAIYRARATLHQNSMKESSSAQLTGEHLEHIEAKRIGTLLQFETLKLDWGNPGIRLPGTVYSLSSPTLLGYDDMGVELSWYVDIYGSQCEISSSDSFKVRRLILSLTSRL